MQPLGIYRGKVPNPHIAYGQEDIETAPVTFARYATRWGDVQLSNGWQRTNFGKRFTYKAAQYLAMVAPVIPGQQRLSGNSPSDFPIKGMAPSQWDSHIANTAGLQPQTPGGPGQLMGTLGNVYGGGGA